MGGIGGSVLGGVSGGSGGSGGSRSSDLVNQIKNRGKVVVAATPYVVDADDLAADRESAR